ncbi:MAG TPA: TatD family hydrolase [Salinivirgaceae bacterium]|nr:TatD family hydrolase [Salinivirgaceae bacterium]
MIDTHAHLYLPQFDHDRNDIISRSREAGIKAILLPNIDMASSKALWAMCRDFPGYCYPMAGLHPTNVGHDYKLQLSEIKKMLSTKTIIAIGETGIDLYWDTSTYEIQVEAFSIQIEWALENRLPIVIHARQSLPQIFDVLDRYKDSGLRGVFHCFSGEPKDVEKIVEMDMYMYFGIGGVVTFKNGNLDKTIELIPKERILVETDSPYLAPVPYRGQRNESAYLPLIIDKIAKLKKLDAGVMAEIVTKNAQQLFNIPTNNE